MVSTANLAPFFVPARDQIVPLMQIVTLCPKRKYDPTTTKFAHFSPHRFRKQIAYSHSVSVLFLKMFKSGSSGGSGSAQDFQIVDCDRKKDLVVEHFRAKTNFVAALRELITYRYEGTEYKSL